MKRAAVRVCHVTPHLPPDQAANALLPATLGRLGVADGWHVTFVAHEPAQGRGVAQDSLAGPVAWVPRRGRERALVRLTRLGALRVARAVHAALDRAARDANLLHLHSNGLIIEVAAAWARRRGVRTVLTLYGTEIWHYEPRPVVDPFRRAYDEATAVAFYSQGLLDHARQLGLNRRGLSVIYPAVSDRFRPADEATRTAWREALGFAGRRVVLNVKRLHPLAGQDTLIDAFARLADDVPDVHLVIVGAGPLRDDLIARARSAGLDNRVTLTGLLPNDEVARIAAVADAFALPSRLEALPTVAVEALAAGTPVVSADHPGGLELHALFGNDVRVVPREAPDRLAAALAEVLASGRRAGAATAEIVRDRFSLAAVRHAYRALYAGTLPPGRIDDANPAR
jgi:glycosyltransferase involved in cell wall biosynthesis